MRYILRTCYNTPAMLKLSLELQQQALDAEKFITVFCVDYPQNPHVMDIIKNFKGKKAVIIRPTNYGLTKNILEGMKGCFDCCNRYLIQLCSEVVIADDFFRFIEYCYHHFYSDDLLSITGLTSGQGQVNKVRYHDWYGDYGIAITNNAWDKYIKHHANQAYYTNPKTYLRKQFGNMFDLRMTEQAGLIQRIRKLHNLKIIIPLHPRSGSVGIYSQRKRSRLTKLPWPERYAILKDIYTSKAKLTQYAQKDLTYLVDLNPHTPEWNKLELC